MALPGVRKAALIAAVYSFQLLRVFDCKSLSVDADYVKLDNERGEYVCSDHRHFHISNQPLILPNVTTKNGMVRGIVINVGKEREVYGFLGIPFAKPPVGDLRFKGPVPVDNWNTTHYDAVGPPPACSQIPSNKFPGFQGESMWNPNTPISEDCLYLNIWVSAETFNTAAKNGTHNTTVMFWIYGGGFTSGSSSLELYDGSKLADEGGVIVVSTQYRVGPFGFLYFGNENAQGNMGLLDQNLALRWIYKNIEVFGGDKESITLFGESAGSASVSYHLLSPYSQPFVKRGILMSGTAFSPWAFQTPENGLQASNVLALKVGCGTLDTGKSPEEILECLRNVDADTLLKMSQTESSMSFMFVPTVDGHFIKDNPRNLLRTLDPKLTNIIMGNTKDEGTFFTQYDFVYNLNNTPKLTHEEFVTQMSKLFGPSANASCGSVPVFNLYTNWVNLEDVDENRRRLNEAIGDNLITCPSRAFADAWSSLGNNVYYYHFTQRTSSNPWPDWMGVIHGDEIEYAFGLPNNNNTLSHTEPEKELARHITSLFTNFAKTGIPSPNWIPYSQQSPVYLDLNATVISDKTSTDVYGPRAATCAFWNNYGYQINSQDAEKYVPYVIAA